MISRWIEFISAWRTRRRFDRWYRRYWKAVDDSAWPSAANTASTWETPSEPRYARSSFERNVLGGGEAIGLECRFDEAAVRDLVRIIQSHPARKIRRMNAVVDEYIYSMF